MYTVRECRVCESQKIVCVYIYIKRLCKDHFVLILFGKKSIIYFLYDSLSLSEKFAMDKQKFNLPS